MEIQCRLLALNAPEYGFIFLDTLGFVQTWNEAAYRLLGYTTAEILGQPYSIFYAQDEAISEKPADPLKLALSERRHEEQTQLIRRDQSRFWSRLIFTAILSEEEKFAGFALIIKDLTPYKLAQQAQLAWQQQIHEQNRLLAAIVEKSPAGIALFEPILDSANELIDFNYKLINSVNAATLGLTVDQHLNQSLKTLFPLVEGNIFWRKLTACYHSDQPQQLTGHFIALGFDIWIDGKFNKVGNDVLWMCLDVTQLKQAQVELEKQLISLQEAKNRVDTDLVRLTFAEQEVGRALDTEREMNRLKTEFVKLVSHQFRNPMASISLKAEALRRFSERCSDRFFAQKVAEYCEQVGRDIYRLDKLINEVLFNERMQAGQLEVRRQRLNLVAFCQNLIQQQQLQDGAYQRVIFESGQAMAQLWTDPVLLEQVLENLISNALKYSAGSEKRIEVTLTETANEYILQVKDYGIGIPADALEHVSKSFYRAWNVTQYPGTGLGLSLSHRIIEMLGGGLTIESQQDEYTLCTLRLPKDS
ncbi:ATP-binding protein [Larkinella insperata]|uniref:histidine kinase n=1 Tax=Larkinella insperata TaxID=332158 RepID=A0ABW3QBI3_9BACT